MRLRRFGIFSLAIGLFLSASTAFAVQQVRWMPKYAVRGERVDDPVELKSERKAFQASFEAYKLAAREYQNEVKEFITREIGLREKAILAGFMLFAILTCYGENNAFIYFQF